MLVTGTCVLEYMDVIGNFSAFSHLYTSGPIDLYYCRFLQTHVYTVVRVAICVMKLSINPKYCTTSNVKKCLEVIILSISLHAQKPRAV